VNFLGADRFAVEFSIPEKILGREVQPLIDEIVVEKKPGGGAP